MITYTTIIQHIDTNGEERKLVKVILVRHGETDWNRSKRFQGSNSDIQLNQNGCQQAESIALRLKPERIQAIYSSPLQRARDTAQAITRHHQVEVEIEPTLKEIDAAELEGIHLDELGGHLIQLLTGEGQGKSTFKMYGGETLAEVQQRVWSTVQRLVDRHRDGVLVVVSHYFTILTIICSVLNLPPSQIGRLRLGVGSISILTFDERVTRLTLFNDTCHLASTS